MAPHSCLALLLAALPVPQQGTVAVEWQGRRHAADRLPDWFDESARAAVQGWQGWAQARDYRFVVDGSGLVILLPADLEAAALLDTITRTEKLFETLLPLPAPEESDGDVPPGFAPDEIFGGKRSTADRGSSTTSRWGRGDDDAPVLLIARGPEDYETALARLAQLVPGLGSWTARVRRGAGCFAGRPPFAACLLVGSDQEAWSPKGEVAHRLTRMLVHRRFGPPPHWLSLGLGWYLEREVTGEVWCFPDRTGLVQDREHAGFEASLTRQFARRQERPLGIEELTAVRPGRYEEDSAARAFGMARFLATHEAEVLPDILADLRPRRREDEASRSQQAEVLRRHAGADVFLRAARAFGGHDP